MTPARKAALRTVADVPENANKFEMAAAMGMDALRLSLCQPTRNYTPDTVIRWLQCCAGLAAARQAREEQSHD